MLELLKERKAAVQENTKQARELITAVADRLSFVELDTFRYSKNEFYEEAASVGEGVVTGYARINDNPVCIVAQSAEALKGGVTRAQADKILKCMALAEKSGYPLINILSSSGAMIGEGLEVLDGYAEIIAKASALYGVIPQFSVISGKCFGSIAYYASLSDVVITMKEGVLASTSASVIAAKSGVAAESVGGAEALAKNGTATLTVGSPEELKSRLSAIIGMFTETYHECEEQSLNQPSVSAEAGYKCAAVTEEILDAGTFVEFCEKFGSELKVGLCRIGGMTAGVAISDDKPEGVELTAAGAKKLSRFIRFLDCYGLPFISFVNVAGVEACSQAEGMGLVKDIAGLMSAVADCESAKIAVIAGKAQGAGYTALASKKLGFDYSVAWANAAISVVNSDVAVNTIYAKEIAAAKDPEATRRKVAEKYERIDSDPFNAALNGLVDNIIDPAATRQYLISALFMLNA